MMLAVDENKITPGRNQKEKNGMWLKHHRPESIKAISDKQRQRYDLLRQAVAKACVNDDKIRKVVQEEIKKYLVENATKVNNNKPTKNIPL